MPDAHRSLRFLREHSGRAHLFGNRCGHVVVANFVFGDDPFKQRDAVGNTRLRVAGKGSTSGLYSEINVGR